MPLSDEVTYSLQSAIQNLSGLPPAAQDEIAAFLSSYVERWERLRAGIEKAAGSLDAGHGSELDLEAFLASVRERE